MNNSIRVARTDLLEIAYQEQGPPDGRPVVLLHGWPDDVHTWDGVVSTLVTAGFRTITPYLRGCGPGRFLDERTMRSGQLAALGSDVVELARTLGLERFALVGHDWGARAAYIAATELADRVTHVVAISVGYGTNAPGQALPLVQAKNYWYHWYFALPRGVDVVRQSRRDLGRFMWTTWSPTWTFSEDDYRVTAASFENPDWAEITIHSYRHRWGHAEGDPRYDALEQRLASPPPVTVPTLVLHGAADACNDPLTSAGKERWFANRYERTVLPGIGHFPQREAPDAVARAIVRWLES